MNSRFPQPAFIVACRARWCAWVPRARLYWHHLAVREKRMLLGAGAALLAAMLWFDFIAPPLRAIEHWQPELPRLRSQSAALEEVLRGVPGLTLAEAGQAPERMLRQSLGDAHLQMHCQVRATGPGGWQLDCNAAPAQALMGWLVDIAPHLPLVVVEARLRRAGQDQPQTEAGQLSGIVRMEQAQVAKESS